MGSQPCCCQNQAPVVQEIKIIIEERHTNLQILVVNPQKPIPLEKFAPPQEEDDFGLFLVMEQYERLINKHKKKCKSYSPAGDLLTLSKENMTSYGLTRRKGGNQSKKTRSLTTKVSTSFQSYAIRSILKNKQNNKSQYYQQVSEQQKSIKSVHFDVQFSPKNSINKKFDYTYKKKKILLRSYL